MLKPFKLKKGDVVFYNEDYVCINSCFMLHKTFITTDNPLIENYIKENTPFKMDDLGHFTFKTLPPLKSLMFYQGDYIITPTSLINCIGKETQRLLMKEGIESPFIFIDDRYFKFIEQFNDLKLKQATLDNLAIILILNNNDPIGLIQPINNYVDPLKDIKVKY